MDQSVRAIQAFVASIIGLAIFSVLLSRSSNAEGVILAGGRAFSGVLQAATAPVTGGATQGGGVIYPGGAGGAAAYNIGAIGAGVGGFLGGFLNNLGGGYGGGGGQSFNYSASTGYGGGGSVAPISG